MAIDKHKVISDKLLALLKSLDDERLTKTGKVDLSKSTTTRALDTKREPSLRQKNLQVLVKRTMSRAEREEEAQRLAEAVRPIYPDARCIFVHNTRCKQCKQEVEGIAHPKIFIRLRRLSGTTFHPTDIRYIPESELDSPIQGRLARMVLHHNQEVESCLKCFQNAVHLYSGQNIESSIVKDQSGLEKSSQSILVHKSKGKSAEEVYGSLASPASMEENSTPGQSLGSPSASSDEELLTTANAQHTLSPIDVIEETALRQADGLEEGMDPGIHSSRSEDLTISGNLIVDDPDNLLGLE